MVISIRTWPARLVARPWLLAFVPINAATAGFGVVLPLLILIVLHGTWANVAVAATLYNSTLILSSIVWGHLADRYPYRRAFLVVNYAGYAGLYALLVHVGSLPALYVVYGAIGAIAPAGASASNLLILEKFTEKERATAFASFQEVSMIGSLAGLLLGYFWTEGNDGLLALLAVFAVLALVSAIAVWWGITEAKRRLTTANVASHPESLASRMHPSGVSHTGIPFFPLRPRLGRHPLARLRKWMQEELRHELPLILIASFLFNLSANLFNISYTPYLYSIGLTAAAIFLVNLSNNFTQTLVFPLTGGLANRLGADRIVRHATYFRAIGYLATAGLTFGALTRAVGFGANIGIYAVLGGAIAVYTTASTLMLFRSVAGRDAGSLLGVNSALGGVAAVAGAGVAGILALSGSFRLVFLVSGGVLLTSLPLWAAATIAYRRRRPAEPPATALPESRRPTPSVEPAAAAKTH
jgi:MFS family permease